MTMEDHGWDKPRFSLDHPQALPAPNGFRSWGPKADLSKIDEGILDAVGMGIDYWLYKSNMVKQTWIV